MNRLNVISLSAIAAVSMLLNGCSDSASIQGRLDAMQAEIDAAKLQATRAQDVLDIMNLQARYEAIHSTHEKLAWMLYAPREDSIDEVTHSKIIGFEYIRMQFEDRAKLNQLYLEGKLPEGTVIHQMNFGGGPGGPGGPPPGEGGPPPGEGGPPPGEGGPPPTGAPGDGEAPPMMGGPPGAAGTVCQGNPDAKAFGNGPRTVPPIHPVATYNIVVADDGQTAKATFTSLGYERCGWSYGKYANDYIKIDGSWYIWHKKWLRGFSAPYYMSPDEETVDQIFEWTKERDENGFPVVDKGLHFDYLWYPGKEDMTIVAPKPYKTWTDDEMYWWEGEPTTP